MQHLRYPICHICIYQHFYTSSIISFFKANLTSLIFPSPSLVLIPRLKESVRPTTYLLLCFLMLEIKVSEADFFKSIDANRWLTLVFWIINLMLAGDMLIIPPTICWSAPLTRFCIHPPKFISTMLYPIVSTDTQFLAWLKLSSTPGKALIKDGSCLNITEFDISVWPRFLS